MVFNVGRLAPADFAPLPRGVLMSIVAPTIRLVPATSWAEIGPGGGFCASL
jgi:hypothetical protein